MRHDTTEAAPAWRTWAKTALVLLLPYLGLAAFRLARPDCPGLPLPDAAAARPPHSVDSSAWDPLAPGDAADPWNPWLSEADLRRVSRERGWREERMRLSPWKILVTPDFEIRSDLRLAELRRAGLCLDRIAEALRAAGLEPRSPGPTRIRLFATLAQFRAHAAQLGVEYAAGLYDPDEREVVLGASPPGSPAFLRTAGHELPHAWLHKEGAPTPPAPLSEGLAEEAARRVCGELGLPWPEPPAALAPPLDDLLAFDYEALDDDPPLTRAERYAWLRRLVAFEADRLGLGLGETFDALRTRSVAEWDALDEEWSRHANARF